MRPPQNLSVGLHCRGLLRKDHFRKSVCGIALLQGLQIVVLVTDSTLASSLLSTAHDMCLGVAFGLSRIFNPCPTMFALRIAL